MYAVALKRDFIAQHYLVGGDWGLENHKHTHHYQLELQLEGEILDQHGFLVDIVAIEKALETQISYFRDQALNELQEFAGLNPSMEHFAQILCQSLADLIQAVNIKAVMVKLWENDIAWASFRQEKIPN